MAFDLQCRFRGDLHDSPPGVEQIMLIRRIDSCEEQFAVTLAVHGGFPKHCSARRRRWPPRQPTKRRATSSWLGSRPSPTRYSAWIIRSVFV